MSEPTSTLHSQKESDAIPSYSSYPYDNARDTCSNVVLMASNANSNLSPNQPDTFSTANSTAPFPYAVNTNVKEFAKAFRQKRITLGLTQVDVANAVSYLNNQHVCQTTICRFETGRLPLSNIRKLGPMFAKWLNCCSATAAEVPPFMPFSKRKKAVINASAKAILERSFRQNPFPSKAKKDELGLTLDMGAHVIKNWFHNRRQREKRNNTRLLYDNIF